MSRVLLVHLRDRLGGILDRTLQIFDDTYEHEVWNDTDEERVVLFLDIVRPFEPPEGAPPAPITVFEPFEGNRWVTHDLGSDIHTLRVLGDRGVKRYDEIDLTVSMRVEEWYSHVGDDHLSAKGETIYDVTFERGDWKVRTVTRQVLTSSKEAFRVVAELDAWENDVRVHCESWDVEVPRQGV